MKATRPTSPPSLSVAPAANLRQEMRLLQDREVLRTTLEIEQEIFIQSLTGRAHEGHGTFAGRRYVDTTEDDIARALSLDPVRTRAHRQRIIDDVVRWAERVMAGETPRFLVDDGGEPILGFSPFRVMDFNPTDVLGGLYLGGMRDTQEIRLEAERRFGVTIGAGKLFFVNTEVMARLGLNGDQLAHGAHGDKIPAYRQAGLIGDEPPSAENAVSYMYIRHHPGPGASDDAAIAIAGRMWGQSVAAGVFLADAIDTLEKYVPPECYADQDARLARAIADGFPALRFTEQDAVNLTYLSRGGDGIPDSSLRHLLRVDRAVDQCAAEAHLLFSAGLPYARMGLGHEKVTTSALYRALDQRLAEFAAVTH